MLSHTVSIVRPVADRLAWAALAASSLAAALILDPGAWQLWALLAAPDAALFAGIGRNLSRGQLQPGAVPLYNALHRPVGPAGLAIVSVWLGPAWLAGALAWFVHIAVDRAVGYRLRDARGFQRG